MAKQIIRALVALLATFTLFGCSVVGSLKQGIHEATAPAVTKEAVEKQEVTPVSPLPTVQAPIPVVAQVTNVTPESLQSLKPFTKFKKGEGEGYAYEYKSRTKAQFVALLRNPVLAKKEMRVSCEVLVRQMAEVHGLPFEGCEGAAAEIERNSDYEVVTCGNWMLTRNGLAVTSKSGKQFGTWHRACLVGEKVMTYKGKPIVSTMCLNPVVPDVLAIQAPVLVTTPIVNTMCTQPVYAQANIWNKKAMDIRGVKEAIQATRGDGRGYYAPDRISRGFGSVFRAEHQKGNLPRSVTNYVADARVVKSDGSTVHVFQGTITEGMKRFPLHDFGPGDTFVLMFGDLSKLVSPVSDIRAKYEEFYLVGCGPTTHLHAIEK